MDFLMIGSKTASTKDINVLVIMDQFTHYAQVMSLLTKQLKR